MPVSPQVIQQGNASPEPTAMEKGFLTADLFSFMPQFVLKVVSKDCIEKIDFQDPFFAVVNWPISEFSGASVCIMHYFDRSASNQLANVFLIAGCGFL